MRCNRAAAKGTELPNACPGYHRDIAKMDNKEEEFPVTEYVEVLDMKLETAVLRCVIKKPCALDPLEVND